MAIYHFSAKVISRANGSSAVASAAYRSASRLHDERLDRAHDFSNKAGVVHSEVMLPEGAPERLSDRTTLWNEVEAGEVRKDAQLSREVEFAIPHELSQQQGIDLARDFVRSEFVDRGMIADLNVHWDAGADGLPKPHAHVMLTMREVGEDGFGAKVRDWNKTELVQTWRERWADHVNARLASLDIDARIDHRSLEAQGIDLEPQNKIGPAAARMEFDGLEVERIAEHAEIAQRNGARIIAEPTIALDAITRQQATFTKRDLAMFVHRYSDGKGQYDRAMSAVQASPDLIALGRDGKGEERFTSRDMIAVEERLQRSAKIMADRDHHRAGAPPRERALAAAEARGLSLSGEQRAAFDHVTEGRDLGVVIGYAGTGKSAMLGVAREAWEGTGLSVRGAALSGIAAENLEAGSTIPSRTIASLEHQWGQGRELLTANDVLVVDEAGMIGSRQMERVLSAAEQAGAKVVLVGDPDQLQAIEAGAAFRAIAERHGGVEITEIRRQRIDWQRDATRELATGRTPEALRDYADHGMVHAAETRAMARAELIEAWNRERIASPDQSRIILTHTNDEVRDLNELARGKLREAGQLGDDVTVKAERGERQFATGDRIMFLRSERGMGVKNGTLATIERLSPEGMAVRLDDGRGVAFDTRDYAHVDHGYAATIHKSQGVTVDRAHVLATPGMDRHSAYVGMSRHRDDVQLHYGRDDFTDRRQLVRALSRDRGKDMAGDYAKPEQDQARAFADRREIRFPELARQVVEKVRDKAKGMFAGFRPKPATEKATSPERVAADRSLAPSQARAIERYGRAAANIGRMQEKGLPVLAHQEQALSKAGDALDQVRPQGARDLASAIERDPRLARDAAEGNTGGAAKAMETERQVRIDPEKRAGRFVEQWHGMKEARASMERAGDRAGAEKLGKRMEGIAGGLHRDPQLESVLRSRAPELTLSMERSRSIGQELAQSVAIGRDQDRGMSR